MKNTTNANTEFEMLLLPQKCLFVLRYFTHWLKWLVALESEKGTEFVLDLFCISQVLHFTVASISVCTQNLTLLYRDICWECWVNKIIDLFSCRAISFILLRGHTDCTHDQDHLSCKCLSCVTERIWRQEGTGSAQFPDRKTNSDTPADSRLEDLWV